MTEQNPRIQMESKEDLEFLIKEFKQYARSLLQKEGESIAQVTQKRQQDNPETVTKQAAHKIDKWIEHIFQLAGHGIAINGVPLAEAQDEQVYQPLDENLRNQAQELQQQVQEAMVQIGQARKQAPQLVRSLVSSSLEMLTDLTTKGRVEGSDLGEIENQPVNLTLTEKDYVHTLDLGNELLTDLPMTLEKAQQVSKLLDDLNIPLQPGPELLAQKKRRRSSMLAQLSQGPEMSPKKAREGLLGRLNAEAKKI
ncbi:hypothetical protein EDD86DRAFT_268603, partial [Gorgonomyces haynaldii]